MNVPPGIITISDGQEFTVAAKAGEMMNAIATPVINNITKKTFFNTVVVTANKNKLKFRLNISKTFTV
ncbi:hypothetical protein [Nostoc sp. CALU 546]|uniref:hypothetical protein n=1 Tax=Nostoc sp. CALU 546 TaxID=1867241 RepID=UPI003B66F99A